ncbi:phage protein Gp36 family protein, partial [Capnocytophaga canis]|uniref:phage protein Gp36 family protein n=1 Tax=Capnocytophaga canis TaxID=1848903 RepID=UPI0037D1CA2C
SIKNDFKTFKDMYLTPNELHTHIYEEELQAIIREDETIVLSAIDTAVEYASSKLAKTYDIEAIFSAEGKERNPLLLSIIKDITLWELVNLANPSVDYEKVKFRYERAMDWLTAVFKGMPANLPKRLEEPQKNNSVSLHSNPKRNNYF